MWKFPGFIRPLWQLTEYNWVVDKARHLRTSSLSFGKHWFFAFFAIFWHFIDQRTNRLIKKWINSRKRTLVAALIRVHVLMSVVSAVTLGQTSSWHQLWCSTVCFLFIFIYNLVDGYCCWFFRGRPLQQQFDHWKFYVSFSNCKVHFFFLISGYWLRFICILFFMDS